MGQPVTEETLTHPSFTLAFIIHLTILISE